MIKQIVKVADRRILFELPADYVGHEVEILAFRLDEAGQETAGPTGKEGLLAFPGLLRDSPNFTGDPVLWGPAAPDIGFQ